MTDNVTNLGYLLGDEGSGTHLGKSLIRPTFTGNCPGACGARWTKPFREGRKKS
ncbi:MAG: hypothetical protein H6559_34425 [Lewinellaceae bacterium]|nr:hypothetical protein [Lewinellaceae bacterium]